MPPEKRAVFARYILTGLTTALLYFACGAALMRLTALSPAAAAATAFVAVVLVNYAMHYYFTFQADGAHLPVLSRYLVMTGCGMLINWWLAEHLFPVFQSMLAVQFICALAVVAWNLVLNMTWVFMQRGKA